MNLDVAWSDHSLQDPRILCGCPEFLSLPRSYDRPCDGRWQCEDLCLLPGGQTHRLSYEFSIRRGRWIYLRVRSHFKPSLYRSKWDGCTSGN